MMGKIIAIGVIFILFVFLPLSLWATERRHKEYERRRKGCQS